MLARLPVINVEAWYVNTFIRSILVGSVESTSKFLMSNKVTLVSDFLLSIQ